MAIQKTIGGERLGAGDKMQVALRNYERSTHDLGYVWRSSMAPGVLVPFLKQLSLNGDSFDINLASKIRTLPTVMPLFGTFKLQLDVFFAPLRLYQGLLHNNMTKIGMEMSKVKLPKIILPRNTPDYLEANRYEKGQISPSSLLKYLGVTSPGQKSATALTTTKSFNAAAILAYYDIFKNYYSFKQEDNAYIVTYTTDGTKYMQSVGWRNEYEQTGQVPLNGEWTIQNTQDLSAIDLTSGSSGLRFYPTDNANEPRPGTTILIKGVKPNVAIQKSDTIGISGRLMAATGGEKRIDLSEMFNVISYTVDGTPGTTNDGTLILRPKSISAIGSKNPEFSPFAISNGTSYYYQINSITQEDLTIEVSGGLALRDFPLENIDKARQTVLRNCDLGDQVEIDTESGENKLNFEPYLSLVRRSKKADDVTENIYPMNGLCIKTYLSDMFNNWITAEWVDQINQMTSLSTETGNFTMETLYFKRKQYEILNAVAISGGTWEDWQEAIYGQDAIRRAEIPIYMGGMSSYIGFDEVVSNSASETTAAGEAPLGTLAGRGVEGKQNGGHIQIKVQEPGYIIGIASITPLVDYTQGNDWDMNLDSIDDLHKPGLDQIGFQDLITEKMAGICDYNGTTFSAGKQPAWLDYMTNVNKAFGDFTEEDVAMGMILARRYEYERAEDGHIQIKDLTTYIDPQKHNYAFADTRLESQNFWVQIAVDIEARRKMSAAVMPNL